MVGTGNAFGMGKVDDANVRAGKVVDQGGRFNCCCHDVLLVLGKARPGLSRRGNPVRDIPVSNEGFHLFRSMRLNERCSAPTR